MPENRHNLNPRARRMLLAVLILFIIYAFFRVTLSQQIELAARSIRKLGFPATQAELQDKGQDTQSTDLGNTPPTVDSRYNVLTLPSQSASDTVNHIQALRATFADKADNTEEAIKVWLSALSAADDLVNQTTTEAQLMRAAAINSLLLDLSTWLQARVIADESMLLICEELESITNQEPVKRAVVCAMCETRARLGTSAIVALIRGDFSHVVLRLTGQADLQIIKAMSGTRRILKGRDVSSIREIDSQWLSHIMASDRLMRSACAAISLNPDKTIWLTARHDAILEVYDPGPNARDDGGMWFPTNGPMDDIGFAVRLDAR